MYQLRTIRIRVIKEHTEAYYLQTDVVFLNCGWIIVKWEEIGKILKDKKNSAQI